MKKKKNFKVTAEIVKGECPTCNEVTTLVGIDSQFYRCMECGGDLEQHVNGSIKYIPKLQNPKQISKYFEQIEDGKES